MRIKVIYKGHEFHIDEESSNETTIKYQIALPAYVILEIYNIRGQKIRTLVSKTIDPGTYKAVWNGTNDSGLKTASGVYVYVIKTDTGYRDIKKMRRIHKAVII